MSLNQLTRASPLRGGLLGSCGGEMEANGFQGRKPSRRPTPPRCRLLPAAALVHCLPIAAPCLCRRAGAVVVQGRRRRPVAAPSPLLLLCCRRAAAIAPPSSRGRTDAVLRHHRPVVVVPVAVPRLLKVLEWIGVNLHFIRILAVKGSAAMEDQTNAVTSVNPRVKANLFLGGESFTISFKSGIVSEQLAAMKEKSMVILKDYITKHNASNDVPDESIEGASDDEGEVIANNPPKKSKKQK